MRALKWIGIILGALVVLVIVALLVIPAFVDIEDYKPRIEQMVSDATNRPFELGGDISLSLFPWAGLSLTDVHMGNPEGFEKEDFASIRSFEVRVKLLPLITRDVQVKKFILEGPRVVLIRNQDGRCNWKGIGKPAAEPQEKKAEQGAFEGLPLKGLAVGEFVIRDGSVVWIDRVNDVKRELTDAGLELQDVSLDKPVGVDFSAKFDGKPLSLRGDIGPLGEKPGAGTIPLTLTLEAFDQITAKLDGKFIDPASKQNFDVTIDLSPFSPRELMETLGQPFPVQTRDPEALSRVALEAAVAGGPETVKVTDGTLELDDSTMALTLEAKDFEKPNLAFDLEMDRIDLDRYLPPKKEGKAAAEKEAAPEKAKEVDYAPLRKPVLDGRVRINELMARGTKVENLDVKLTAKNGLYRLERLGLNLYEGDVSGNGTVDVRRKQPKTHMEINGKGIQANPLLNDFLKKDFLEGQMETDITVDMAGDKPEQIKRTLNGKGDFLFTDGAIKGINLTAMVQGVKTAFGLAEKGKEPQRTDFSKLHAPFTMTNGVVETTNTTMVSPLLRIVASGNAHLPKETLDFRVEPKFVGTLKGQDDEAQRSGITVPVKVTGTFSSPKFRPDLKGEMEKRIKEEVKPSKLLDRLKGKEEGGAEEKPLEEKAKDMLKGLPFGK